MILELLTLGLLTVLKPEKPKLPNIKSINETQLIEPYKAPELPKVEEVAKIPVTPPPSSGGSQNSHTGFVRAPQGYYYQCAGWVASHRPVPTGWGDADNWRNSAKKAGWTVSNKPVAGAIGWTPGHVVYVVSVQKSTVTISEQNYDNRNSIRTVTVPTSKYTYLY